MLFGNFFLLHEESQKAEYLFKINLVVRGLNSKLIDLSHSIQFCKMMPPIPTYLNTEQTCCFFVSFDLLSISVLFIDVFCITNVCLIKIHANLKKNPLNSYQFFSVIRKEERTKNKQFDVFAVFFWHSMPSIYREKKVLKRWNRTKKAN